MSTRKRLAVLLLTLCMLLELAPSALAATAPSTYSTKPKSSVWNTYKASLHYYYQQLSKDEKRAFSAKYDALALGKPELWSIYNFGLTYSQRMRVEYAVMYDCPELMFADYQYSSFTSSEEIMKQYQLIKEYLPQTIKALKKIQKRGDYAGGAFNHQYAFDRYVVQHCKYLLDDKTYNGTRVPYKGRRAAYSVFVNNVAVCEGYARGAQLALRYFGIPCLYVYGDANGSHAWNLVRLGGEWYHYDATWNDADNSKLITDYLPYFNLPDRIMNNSHTLNREASTKYSFTLPKCTSNKYEYYKKQGQYIGSDWKKKIPSLLSSAKRHGNNTLGIRMTNETTYKAALNALKKNQLKVPFACNYWYNNDAYFFFFSW
ncbi:MAG: hypothetical protein IJ662_13565 [Clostridia bacterium]|nr:hypothetical protein [Clostridia bacterium]